MADTVTTQTIIDGERNCVMKFTNVSDGRYNYFLMQALMYY
jgi:hypothetical protein